MSPGTKRPELIFRTLLGTDCTRPPVLPTADTITVNPHGTTGNHAEHEANSEDLRTKIVNAVQEGMSNPEVARLFGVNLSSVKRYAKTASRRESLKPRKGGGRQPKSDQTMKSDYEETWLRREIRKSVGHGPFSYVMN